MVCKACNIYIRLSSGILLMEKLSVSVINSSILFIPYYSNLRSFPKLIIVINLPFLRIQGQFPTLFVAFQIKSSIFSSTVTEAYRNFYWICAFLLVAILNKLNSIKAKVFTLALRNRLSLYRKQMFLYLFDMSLGNMIDGFYDGNELYVSVEQGY